MYLLAARTEVDQWLEDHPLALGGGALVLGLILLGFGIAAIRSGKSTSKYGVELEGPMAELHGVAMAGAGLLVVMFGGYKLFMGIFG